MEPIAQLPRPLTGWSVLRQLFDDQLATALELLVHRLSAGIDLQHESTQRVGDPDGFRGITRRGPVSRLLLSELALADELEDELFRRITQGEAGYYDLAAVEGARAGRMVVLFDAGPEQLGAARIGHLATILLVWRRASLAGVRLEIGTLQRPDETCSGELRELVVWWLGSRTHELVTHDEVAELAAGWSGDDEWWVCCGTATAARSEWPPGVEVVTFEESGGDADGATHLLARHRARRALVPLPPRVDAIRLLRGRGFRRVGSPRARPTGAIRHPRFPGASAHLLCRTDRPETLISVTVPGPQHAATPRPKRRTFTGPVIAAGYIGARTVAVTCADDQLLVEVIGKHLSNVGGLAVPLVDVDVSESDLDLLGVHAPRSLAFSGGDLLIDLPSGWWQVGSTTRPTRHPILATAPSYAPDLPFLVRPMSGGLFVHRLLADAPADGPLVLGAGHIGWSGPAGWVLASLTSDDRSTVDVDRPPAGIVTFDGEPVFVMLSSAGQIVRLVGRTTTTLTRVSGDVVDIAVHPLKPLIAVQHHDGSITVYDVGAETVVLRMRSDAE